MPIPKNAGTSALKRGLLRDDVYARLRDAIVDGTFSPGEQLRDQDLAEWLGVSRTPVREAILRLSAAGLVSAAPGRSTIVAPLESSAIRDAQSVVAAMHRLAVELAVAFLPDGRIQGVRMQRSREPEPVTLALQNSWLNSFQGRTTADLASLPQVPEAARSTAAAISEGIRSLCILREMATRPGILRRPAPEAAAHLH